MHFISHLLKWRMVGKCWGLLVFVLLGCKNSEQIFSEKNRDSDPDISNFSNFDFSSDSFELSKSFKSQTAVFESIFFSSNKYQLSHPLKSDLLYGFFNDLRNSHYKQATKIDYSFIRREYHTFTHAMDVFITTHCILQSGGKIYFTQDEQVALLFAALGHDALHTGVNNSFLMETKHPYSKESKKVSVQEERSADYMIKLFNKYGIFSIREEMKDIEKNNHSKIRKLVQQSILWTDIKKHKRLMTEVSNIEKKVHQIINQKRTRVSNFKTEVARKSDINESINISGFLELEERIILASFILHCADVSNPGKEWTLCERWAGLVMNEFFSQGDLEKKLGLKPSMNCDRDKVSVPACQIGFGDYVIRDLYKLLRNIVYDSGETLLNNFELNQKNWKELLKKEKKSGIAYQIKFEPPTKEGGWIGQFRENEK